MTPLHGIACFYDVGFGARAVSRKTPIYFIENDDTVHKNYEDRGYARFWQSSERDIRLFALSNEAICYNSNNIEILPIICFWGHA